MKKTLTTIAALMMLLSGTGAQAKAPAYLMTKDDMMAIYQQSFDRMNTTMEVNLITLDEVPELEKQYFRKRKEDLIISSLPMEGDKSYEDALRLAKSVLIQRTDATEAELDVMGVYPQLTDYVYIENESEWEFYFTPRRDTDIMLDHEIPAEGEYRVVIGAQSGHVLSFHWYSKDNLPDGRLVNLAKEAAMAHSGMEQEAFDSKFADGYVHHYNRDTTTCLVLIYTYTADQPDGDNHVYQATVNYCTGEIVKLEYTEGVG